ncbi:alkaline phosphatase family protein [Streptomyces phaeoluteigriseus]
MAVAIGRDNALDHVVVLMFENRSFDNLLGRLYEPGEVPSFEGVLGKELSNPIPAWAEDGAERGSVGYDVATSMNTPSLDPGEEYPHVNTQLFGVLDEPGAAAFTPPYNAPAPGVSPTMDGFVADYISTWWAATGRQPRYQEYRQIMAGYTPAQVPVMSTLAKGFATFDHWFCEVPSQTFTNRSFFHAGTSSGLVVNLGKDGDFVRDNTAEALFDRLDAAGLDWRVYCDPLSHYSLTGLIHAPRLRDRFATHFFSTTRFFEDAERGELPRYSFIEPQIIGWAHNDMHPPFWSTAPGLVWDPPSSVLGGEDLLARVYDAVRSSSSPHGSNHLNTTLLVTFDEHGGTYDHVPPGPAPAPTAGAPAGQHDFCFDRLGVRVPTIAVSAWIPERTVVTREHRATSLLATLRERWNLGPPLTERDATAATFTDLFTRNTPRPQENWPEVTAQPVPPLHESLVPLDAPLGSHSKALFASVFAIGAELGSPVTAIDLDRATGSEAIAATHGLFHKLFPGVHA